MSDDQKAYQTNLEFSPIRPDRIHEPVFRPVKKGTRKTRFEVKRDIGRFNLKIVGPYLLGEDDADVYFTLLAMAARQRQFVHADLENEIGKEVWEELEAKANAKSERTLAVRTTIYNLLKEVGRNPEGRSNYGWLLRSLDRMAHAGITVRENLPDGRRQWGMNMIGYAFEEKENHDALVVSIDARAAQAILPEGLSHRKINLDERRALKSDRAKSLHKWICTAMNEAEERTIGIDKLARKIWRDFDDIADSTKRKRRSRVKDTLEELKTITGEDENLDAYDYKIRGKGGDAQVTIFRP
ncbi:MAG: replication protein C, IncQ-type [bacterium]